MSTNNTMRMISAEKLDIAKTVAAEQIKMERRKISVMRIVAEKFDGVCITAKNAAQVRVAIPDAVEVFIGKNKFCTNLTVQYAPFSVDSFAISYDNTRRLDAAALLRDADDCEQEVQRHEEVLKNIDAYVKDYNHLCDVYATMREGMATIFNDMPYADLSARSVTPEEFAALIPD